MVMIIYSSHAVQRFEKFFTKDLGHWTIPWQEVEKNVWTGQTVFYLLTADNMKTVLLRLLIISTEFK